MAPGTSPCSHGIDHPGWCPVCRSEQQARYLHPSVPRVVAPSSGRCPACREVVAAGTVVARIPALGWVHPACAMRALASRSG